MKAHSIHNQLFVNTLWLCLEFGKRLYMLKYFIKSNFFYVYFRSFGIALGNGNNDWD